jgi:hypothetical protein
MCTGARPDSPMFRRYLPLRGCSSSRFLEIQRQLRHNFTVSDRTADAWCVTTAVTCDSSRPRRCPVTSSWANNGGAKGIRTPDLLDANESRYQLRHSP